nr:hypothetical protein [Tanacetum cinerariifolium]
KRLDMVELPHENCWTGCCLYDAMGGLEKDDHKSAPTVGRLAIGPVTVKADLLLTTITTTKTTTIRGPKGQMQGVLLALNVEFKDITRIDILKLVVEMESYDMSSDELDKKTRSFDGFQPKQADRSCVYVLNEPRMHEIHVVPSKHEADQSGQLMASGERDGLTDRIRRLGLENLKVRDLLCIERDQVDSLRHHMALSQEEFCQIRKDHDDARRRLKRLESFVERRLGFRP